MTKGVVCIAGAHRSGTSMLTRLLHRCGVHLGAESDLMPAAADNPDGFWENLRFVKLNDEILNAVGAAWDLPPWRDQTFDGNNLRPMRAKAQLLIEEFVDQPVWGWKDPRNCLTLRFWQSLLPGLATVMIIRNPLEVAYSMHKRNGTSYALGLRLWEIYNRRLLANTRPDNRIITEYQTFFDDPRSELRRIALFAGLNEEAADAAAGLVALTRRHTTFTVEQMIDAGVSERILELYQSLAKGANTDANNHIPKVEGDQLAGAGSRLNPGVPNSEDVRKELATRRGDAIRHGEEIARHQKTIEGLRDELAAKSVKAAAEISRRDGRIEELQKAYAHLDEMLERELGARQPLLAELEKFRQQAGRDSTEISSLRERFTQTNQLLQKISLRLADFEARNESLTERLRKQSLEMKRLLRLLDQVDDASILLRQSRRWKLGNPFAAIWASVTGKTLPGFGHLDKNVDKYRQWRSAHPEVASLADEIQALRPRENPSPADFSDPAPTPRRRVSEAPAKPAPPKRPIAFSRHDNVEVSIVIPVYNQLDFTLACLASIQDHTEGPPCEVIVVDDASTDSTPEVIGKIPGLTYLRADSNAGFIASCNRGAEAARGKYLVFLNNDTTVTDHWLTALHETFDLEPEAGLVGSKLLYPDGRLQEAGGIIWRDGSGWNRGKFQDPANPDYNYLKEVSYCSAASIMIPRSLFQDQGGFDHRYAPAYYEDTDLAFKIARTGRRILCQPLSEVIHYEGMTSGTDTSTGVKRFQEVNRGTFATTWASTLASLPKNGDIDSYDAPKPGKKRILVIDHHLPMPDRDSGSLRMFNILTILKKLGHHVTFLPDNLADIPPYGDELRKRGVMFLYHPYVKSVRDYLQTNGAKYDLVILSRCDFARKHIGAVREYAPRARLIFDTVDLHFLRQEREAELLRDPVLRECAREKHALELDLIDQADETWVVSPVEADLLRLERPDKSIQVVSNIVDVPGSALPFAARHDFLFIGSFQHPPNTDAVLYFVKDIFPAVRNRIGGAKFFIIGDKAPPEVIAVADEDIIVTGFQPDVSFYFNSVKLSIAPLRFGAGVKGKINQSMGFGVPVVATSIAAEGMRLTPGEDIMIADDPESFAAALLELYQSEDLWQRLSDNSCRKMQAVYSMSAASEQLRLLTLEASPDVAEDHSTRASQDRRPLVVAAIEG